MTLRSLKLRARALFARRRAERELDEELAFHIEREAQKHIAAGMSPAEARVRARARFGSVTVAADECRDARGTALLDNVVRDVLYALRTFRRAPLASFTIVMTLALGLGLIAVVFTFFNAFIFRVDAVRDPHELFAVLRPRAADGQRPPFTRPQYETLVRETGVFSGAYAINPEVDTPVEGRTMVGALVTGNFFEVLGVGAARGRTLWPADDQPLGGNAVVVLSDSGWERYFARDPHVLGRTLVLNNVSYQIVGVMPAGFRGLRVSPPDYWAPLSLIGRLDRNYAGREDAADVEIIGRLRPGLSRPQALAALIAWDARSTTSRAGDRPRANLLLEPRLGTAPLGEAMTIVAPLLFSFGLILVIGCANVANLLLARAFARQSEIGIRLATGASRRRIICQLLTESLLLALMSAALAYGISRIVLEFTLDAVASSLPPDMGDIRLPVPPGDWRVAVFLMIGAFASTLVFALVPALQATRVELVRAIRGEVVRDARPGRTRGALIVLQVTASALLLVCSAVFLRSAMAASTADPGFRTADTIVIGIEIEKEPLRAAILGALRREPSVIGIAASASNPLGQSTILAEGTTGRQAIGYRFVSPEFFDVFGVDIVRGRGFTPDERNAHAAAAIVSESAARQLWPDRDPLGQLLKIDPDPSSAPQPAAMPTLLSRTAVVVGIARNVPGFRFLKFRESLVYVPIDTDAAHSWLTMRVRGDPEVARRALVERLALIDSNPGSVLTLRTIAGMPGYFLRIGFWLTLALGGLALVLTLSGLFSVLSYLVEQRSREIGVRMALGASRAGICAFVILQLARPVGVGLLIGGGLVAALGSALLAMPAAELISANVNLLDPVAYGASLLCIVTACACAALIPALRAGRIDPLSTLRRD